MVAKKFSRYPHWAGDTREAAMEIFCAAKVADVEDQSDKTCRCGEKVELVGVIIDSLTGDVVHLFKCQCGERTWQE